MTPVWIVVGLVVAIVAFVLIAVFLYALDQRFARLDKVLEVFVRSSDILNNRATSAEAQVVEQREMINRLTVVVAEMAAANNQVAFLQEQLAAHQVALVDATQRSNATLLGLLTGNKLSPRPARPPDDGFRTSPVPDVPVDTIEHPAPTPPLQPDHRTRGVVVPPPSPPSPGREAYEEPEDAARREEFVLGDLIGRRSPEN